MDSFSEIKLIVCIVFGTTNGCAGKAATPLPGASHKDSVNLSHFLQRIFLLQDKSVY